jgi:hypothetical protein
VGDIDTAAVDSLKTLDPKQPIREATEQRTCREVRLVPERTSAAHSMTSSGEDPRTLFGLFLVCARKALKPIRL